MTPLFTASVTGSVLGIIDLPLQVLETIFQLHLRRGDSTFRMDLGGTNIPYLPSSALWMDRAMRLAVCRMREDKYPYISPQEIGGAGT